MMDIQKMVQSINVEKTFRQGVGLVKDNLPVIFSASAIGCLGLSMYETAIATHKADEVIAEEEARRAAMLPLYENTDLTPMEKVNLCWKHYIKAALYGGACVFFIVASERKGNEKYLALMSAYELTKKAGEDRKEAEVDILGEDKAQEIDTVVRQKMVQTIDADDPAIQVVPGNGDKTLYVEPFTNTPFWATYEDVIHAFNYVNYKKNKLGVASVNDFLESLDLREMPIATDWGWNEDQAYIEPFLNETTLVSDDPSRPATVIGYSIEPQFDYGNDKRAW